MNNNEKGGFNYNYSAKEQAELEKIRKKYLADTKPMELDKMEQIRRLDAGVTKNATTVSLILGIIGAIVMGSGMSLIMTDIKDVLSLVYSEALLIGVIIGFVGIALVVSAYPVYQLTLKHRRKKIAPEILRLTDELLNENK